jgi:peroxiredoxin Q/BCP
MSRIAKNLASLASAVFAGNPPASPLAEGACLPAVSQENQDGNLVNLAETGASGYLLVYFYPKADTPGCTKQACSLRDSYAALARYNLKILGVSTDTADAQKAFKDKFSLPFDLLADKDATIVTAFGVPTTMGFPKRQAFLFNDGKLIWRDLAASTVRQADDITAAIDAVIPTGSARPPDC